MIDRRAYGYSYKIWWSSTTDLYTARASGTNIPDVTNSVRELAIIAIENKLREYRNTRDLDLIPLLKLASLPNLTQIGPVAKVRGITDASTLWDFVEKVQGLWRERHSYESDWDLP